MKFSLQLPTDRVDDRAAFASAEAIAELAGATEAAGFDAVYVTEHPFPPDRWLATGGHHALDPFVSLTAAAMATRQLRLHTHIVVLGYRNPFMLAKSVASLDVVSGGRAMVGVAAGYLEGEFEALGAEFEARNARADESLEAMIAAWSGASVHFEGTGFRAKANTMRPAPLQRPHPPLFVGGNSLHAMRRAVRFAQGWCPFPLPASATGRARTASISDLADLEARIARLRELEAEAGRREPLDICFVPFGQRMDIDVKPDWPALRDQLDALEAMGVGWASVALRGETRAAARAAIDETARELLGR